MYPPPHMCPPPHMYAAISSNPVCILMTRLGISKLRGNSKKKMSGNSKDDVRRSVLRRYLLDLQVTCILLLTWILLLTCMLRSYLLDLQVEQYIHTHINSNTHVSLCLVHKYTYIGAQIHLYWCINARIYHAYVQSSVGAYVHVCAYSVYLS
jgi:hypothetical protein